MKSKDKENLKNHSVAELRVELLQAREKMFRLQFKHKVTPVKNPLEMRVLRRHAARLQTWIREKEAATAGPQGSVR
ncbi:MAG TPA: 50S ribosomal protein L29 [Elusimicrobia bacterium]|nr:50S ribosomal protein L29 [Elusimicrobiota bacterium]HBT62419.1 50S ribosomal protein L29 [Elusimicrobiota bacterium]